MDWQRAQFLAEQTPYFVLEVIDQVAAEFEGFLDQAIPA